MKTQSTKRFRWGKSLFGICKQSPSYSDSPMNTINPANTTDSPMNTLKPST